jgi:hypothetical protein
MKLSIDQLFDETMRLTDVAELADRLVWTWRITSYQVRCQDGTCNLSEPTPDPTELVLNFRDALVDGLGLAGKPDANLVKVCELLAVQTMKRSANVEIETPEHLWVASDDTNANCSCGWIGFETDVSAAFEYWEEHSEGSGLELQEWQSTWLDEFNVRPAS